ncbi:MAG: PQQ-dependent sugar dehydrogenase [Cyclobacteriaceae bacterium]
MRQQYVRVRNALLFGIMICGMLGCSFSRKDKSILLLSPSASSITEQMPGLSSGEIRMHLTHNPQVLVEDTLQKYSAVMIHGTMVDSLSHWQQVDLERYVLAGGGLIGISLHTQYQHKWPWLEKSLRAFYGDQPQPTARSSARLVQATHTDRDSAYWREPYGLGSISLLTARSAAEPALLQQVIHEAIGENHWPEYKAVNKPRAPFPNRFSGVVLVEDLNEPMEMEVLNQGDVLLIERGGQVKFYSKATRETRTIARLAVDNSQSNGLNGLAIDPDFQENHWVYFSYTPAGDPFHQYIARFVLLGDSLLSNTEKVLMKVPIDARLGNHAENALEFDGEGNLYIGMGDFTHDQAGYAAIDERAGHEHSDAQRTAANSNDYRGKILRIHPQDERTAGAPLYTIPEGNLFPKDGSQGRPEIYIMGCRNPYRFSVDPLTNTLYWGDIGPDAGVDGVQGPRGYDEINMAREAGFYGWPYFVANNKPYRQYDFATQEVGAYFDPAAPRNTSPNNTGIRQLPPARPALLWYPYDVTYEFPYLGKGGMNIMAGPVYRYQALTPAANRLPEYYDGKLFIYDWVRSWIRVVTLDAHSQVLSVEPFLDSVDFSKPMDLKFGPDGSLYVLEYGAMGYAANQDAKVRHITYAQGNRPPEAHAVADQVAGGVPLIVTLSAEGSLDYDKEDELRFTWFLDREGTRQEGKEIQHVYETPGIYYPTLQVTDPQGASSEARVKILAGNAPPEISLEVAGNQSFYWGVDTLRYQVQVQDAEDGTVADGGIAPADVQVTFSYQPGQASSLATNVHQANDIKQGEALVEASGCLSCHTVYEKSVGPAYQAIAARYGESEATFEQLAKVIAEGGKGRWPGNLSMPAHPYLSGEETRQIITYILSLKETAPRKDLPLQGTLVTNQHRPEAPGTYELRVAYTDQGAAPIGPIAQSATFVFRHNQLSTGACDAYARAILRAGSTAWILEDGGYLQFNGIDLSGISTLTYRVQAKVSGDITLRLDAPDGPIVGTATMPQPEDEWHPISAPVEATSGQHDLYFVFHPHDPSAGTDLRYLFAVDSITFETDNPHHWVRAR